MPSGIGQAHAAIDPDGMIQTCIDEARTADVGGTQVGIGEIRPRSDWA